MDTSILVNCECVQSVSVCRDVPCVHTSPPLAVSCCLRVSSSCSLTSSCWLFLSRNVSRERILWGKKQNTRQSMHIKKQENTVRKAWDSQLNPEFPERRRQIKRHIYLQQLAFVWIGWFDVSFGQLIDLSSEVSVLPPDFLQLRLGFGRRAAGFETQPGDDGLFGTFRCHGWFVEVELLWRKISRCLSFNLTETIQAINDQTYSIKNKMQNKLTCY